MAGKPPETDADRPDEAVRPTLRQRWQALWGALGAVPAWAAAHRLQALLVALGCLLSVSGLAVVWVLLSSHRASAEPATLAMALEALDRGAYADARQLAERLQQQGTLSAEEFGGPVFVLGAVAAREAEDSWNKRKAPLYLAAARYLEEARNRGFPPGRNAEGLYLLGKSLYLGGQIPASRVALREALKVHRQRQTEIHGLLAGAYLHDANPKLDQALAENALFLADPRLTPAAHNEGLLQRAQILLEHDKLSECTAALDAIPAHTDLEAEAILLRGQVLMREAELLRSKPEATAAERLVAEQKYQAAIKTLQLAQSRDTLSSQATRKAMYLTGICFLELGDQRAAAAQFQRTRTLHADTQEALAATFQEAELARQMQHDAEALAGYRRVLAAVTDPENFSNRWISLDQLRSRILAALQSYLSAQNFEFAVQLSRQLYPLFSRVRATELAAEAYQAWGQSLAAQADRLPAAKAAPLRQLSRTRFRQAGKLYGRLAQLQVASRQYPEQLWNCANAYFEGQDYRHAMPVFRNYLQNDFRQRHAQALLRLGEALLAVNQTDKAWEAFRQCIAFHPRDVAAARARLLASQTCTEKGDLKQAESLLRENLYGEYLTPASKEWREALFALGELLHLQGRYAEAVERLSEAVERYPDVPQAQQARYLLADCYRQGAKTARDQVALDQPESSRAARLKESRDFLQQALHQYRRLQDALDRRQQAEESGPLEKSLLRNCYFAIGGILVDLGQYEEAVKVYAAVVNRYQDSAEALEAYVQLAGAYRRLDKPVEARSTLAQAKVVLTHMKPDASFQQATNYNRKQWSDLLDSLSSL
jgi:TolA-binding protein